MKSLLLLALGAGSAAGHSATLANTGYIQVATLVTAGMANVQATVPAQAGATYQWSLTGGSIPGVRQNAAAFFTAGAVGTATVQCQVQLYGVQTTYTQTVAVAPALPVTAFYYGSGVGADALANTVLGGPCANVASYRFQARYSSPLQAVRVFFIWSTLKSGYQAGQGGTIQVQLKADDGSAAHLPTGPALATLEYGNILAQTQNYPELAFAVPATLVGGHFYHLVFTNVDPNPVANYISLDDLYTDQATAPMQPGSTDAASAVLVKSGTGAWKLRQNFTPILELDFADGGRQGNGYMEVWSSNPRTVSGAAMVREAFQVSGPARTFTRIRIRLQRVAGSSPLALTLTEADGTVMAEGTVPATSVLQGVSDWVECLFPVSHVLATGVAYRLTLSAPADTQYSLYPIRKGADKGFAAATLFPDGCAQFTSSGDAGWTGWDMWGTPNLKTGDLQFLFIP
jgi:hypothetical protein